MKQILLIAFITLGVYLYLSIKLIIYPDYFENFRLENVQNNFCQLKNQNKVNNYNINKNIKRSNFDELVCKNPIKKRKFIWFMFDGFAFD